MSPASRFQMPMPPAPGALDPSVKEPFPKIVTVNETECVSCGALCRFESSSAPHPNSPEFFRTPGEAWIAFAIDTKESDSLIPALACSEACLQRFLRE